MLALMVLVAFAAFVDAVNYDCPERNLTVPTYLEYAMGGAFEHSFNSSTGVVNFRCSGGKVLSGGPLFSVQCQEDGNWTEHTWPEVADCADGRACNATVPDHDADFPDFLVLAPSAPPTPIASGSKVPIVCKSTGYGLDMDWAGFELECVDGDYKDWWQKSGRPSETSCIKIETCPAPHVYGLNIPSHMSTTRSPGGTLTHLQKVEFTCAGGKKMTASAADPDGDEKVAVYCISGVVDEPADGWPRASECVSTCSDGDLGVPLTAGYATVETFTVQQGQEVTLMCNNETHYLDDK